MFTLTLEGVSVSTVFFADRPARRAGHMSTDRFIQNWGAGGNSFAVSPPNAALEILGGEHTGDVVVVEISEPMYDEQTAQLTYRAKALEDLDGKGLLVFDERKDELENVPRSFGQVGLFIDAADADVYKLLYWNSCQGCDLSGTDLSNAYLADAYLYLTNLSGADLRGTILDQADMSMANLSGADLRYAQLMEANLSGANLGRGASVFPTFHPG